MIILLLITMMSLPGMANNITSADIKPLAHHPLHKGWLCHSIIGAIGVFLNSLVIVILFLERNSLISSINVMIVYVQTGELLAYFMYDLNYQDGSSSASYSLFFYSMASYLLHGR